MLHRSSEIQKLSKREPEKESNTQEDSLNSTLDRRFPLPSQG
jgi:hypothetical protein